MTKIVIDKGAVEQAIEALEKERPYLGPAPNKVIAAVTALRAALVETAVGPEYQLQLANGDWCAITKSSYDYNLKHGWTVRVLPPAEPAVEPVAWRAKDANGRWMYGDLPAPELPADAPQLLFTSPPPPVEPAVEPVGYVRMLNGEPTPDDDGCVFSYGENPYRDAYGDEEWVPVSVASPAEVPLLDDKSILHMWHATADRVPMCEHYKHFARAIERAVRQKAGLK